MGWVSLSLCSIISLYFEGRRGVPFKTYAVLGIGWDSEPKKQAQRKNIGQPRNTFKDISAVCLYHIFNGRELSTYYRVETPPRPFPSGTTKEKTDVGSARGNSLGREILLLF